MKRITITLLILSSVAAFVGCEYVTKPSKPAAEAEPNETEPNVPGPNVPPSTDIPAIVPADTFEITGTVVYKSIEGGFFAIDADDGKKYDPIGLPGQFRKDGLKVKVTARLKRDVFSFHMYGSIIEVVNIAAQ